MCQYGSSKPLDNELKLKWQQFFEEAEVNWVFIGSWHPPNVNRLIDLLRALSNSKNNPNFKIWILGSAGNGLLSLHSFRQEDYPFLKILGSVSSKDIDSALLNSSGVILPIWEGAGSNLKSAQALLSGKCIIGSNFSFRGFEEFKLENGVFLGQTPADLAQLINSYRPSNTYNRSGKVIALDWQEITKELCNSVSNIVDCKL